MSTGGRRPYRDYNQYSRNYNNRETRRGNNPNYGWRNRQHSNVTETTHTPHHITSQMNYNEDPYHRNRRHYHTNYHTNYHSHQNSNPRPQYAKRTHKPKHISADPKWIQIPYDANNNEHQTKVSQIITYGQRSRDNGSLTECVIYYGKHVLHTNINGDIIGLYDGGWTAFEQWFWYFLGGNMVYDRHQIFSKKDLFASSIVCGRNLCECRGAGYAFTEGLCKRGWLQGLKCLIEERKINFINERFKLLVETAYSFNNDILRYIMLENKFYSYFDVDTQVNEYDETLWVCCRDQLEKISKPGSGWLHCLESLHYAPVLIKKIHGVKMELKEDDQDEKQMCDNWMLRELNEIKLSADNIKLTKQCVEERLNIIKKLKNNEQVKFKIESCYYGLCADAAGGKLHLIHFWKPHVDRNETKHIFEYIPADSEWGRLRMLVSADFFLTIRNKNIIKLCRKMSDDCQLWRIEQVEIEKENKIWIRIISKIGYKLIFSWNQHPLECSNSMPVLSVSDEIDKIDELCVDIFSVAKNNYSTRYRLYFEKYQHVTNKVILNSLARILNRHSFWRLPVDGSKLYPTKFDCYKQKVANIANILWQFKDKYIQSLYVKQDTQDTQDHLQKQKIKTQKSMEKPQQKPAPPTRSPPPPPPQTQYVPLYRCSPLAWNEKMCSILATVYVPQHDPCCIDDLNKYIDEHFESGEALHYYLTHTIAIQIIHKQAIFITFSSSGESICLLHTELHKNGQYLYAVIIENASNSKYATQPWKIMDYFTINDAFMTGEELLNNYGIMTSDLPIGVKPLIQLFDLKNKIVITEQLLMKTDWKNVKIVKRLNAFEADTFQISFYRFQQLALQSLKNYAKNKEFTSILEFIPTQNKYHLRKLLPIFIPQFQKYVAISFAGSGSINNKNETTVIGIHLNLMTMKNKARLVECISQNSWLHLITGDTIMNNLVLVGVDSTKNNININQMKKTQESMGLHDILGTNNMYYEPNKSINDNFKYNSMNYNIINQNNKSQLLQQFVRSNNIFGWLMNIVGLPQYYNILIEEGFEDFETILEVEETDLIEMHIDRQEHRVQILDAVQNINSFC